MLVDEIIFAAFEQGELLLTAADRARIVLSLFIESV